MRYSATKLKEHATSEARPLALDWELEMIYFQDWVSIGDHFICPYFNYISGFLIVSRLEHRRNRLNFLV
jgi:hypothetical protein